MESLDKERYLKGSFKQMGWKGMEWLNVDKDKDQWLTLIQCNKSSPSTKLIS
jgi:hypothetical protein